jgi:hypothetical protein
MLLHESLLPLLLDTAMVSVVQFNLLNRFNAQHPQQCTAYCSLCYAFVQQPPVRMPANCWAFQCNRLALFDFPVLHCFSAFIHKLCCAVPCCDVLRYLQLGMLVQHREACRSALCFLARLLDPGTALSKLRDQQQQRQTFAGTAIDTSAASMALLQSQLDRVGAHLTRVLMGAVVGALPYGRVADISPVVQVRGVRWCKWVGHTIIWFVLRAC